MEGWRCEWEPTVTEHIYLQITATTSDEKLTKSSQTMEKELGKIIEGLISSAEGIIPGANGVIKP